MSRIEFGPKERNEEAMRSLKAIVEVMPTLTPAGRIERAARSIAQDMSAIHGGRWNVKVNHGCHFVLVAREFD